jgi:hypothetical protein
MEDDNNFDVQEETVLEKFNGEPAPENLAERIYIVNGEIVKLEKFEDGVVTLSLDADGNGQFLGVSEAGPENVKEVE